MAGADRRRPAEHRRDRRGGVAGHRRDLGLRLRTRRTCPFRPLRESSARGAFFSGDGGRGRRPASTTDRGVENSERRASIYVAPFDVPCFFSAVMLAESVLRKGDRHTSPGTPRSCDRAQRETPGGPAEGILGRILSSSPAAPIAGSNAADSSRPTDPYLRAHEDHLHPRRGGAALSLRARRCLIRGRVPSFRSHSSVGRRSLASAPPAPPSARSHGSEGSKGGRQDCWTPREEAIIMWMDFFACCESWTVPAGASPVRGVLGTPR